MNVDRVEIYVYQMLR